VASAIGPGFASHNSLNESAHGLCRVKAHSSGFTPQVNRSERPLTSRFVIPCCPLLSPRFRSVAAPARPTPGAERLYWDYAALPSRSRTCVR
jgi:hypothetical protein